MLTAVKTLIKSNSITHHLFNLQQLNKNFLKQTGWSASALLKESVDRDGKPIPWLSYSCINYLDRICNKTLQVFEYGSGNSTLWFSKKCGSIHSIEHEISFYNKLRGRLGGVDNVKLRKIELHKDTYPSSIVDTQKKFNIIIIDGRYRNRCAKTCLDFLTNDGIIIFDNSNRPHYKEGIDFLKSKNLLELPFRGLGPGSPHLTQTSIFYTCTSFHLKT